VSLGAGAELLRGREKKLRLRFVASPLEHDVFESCLDRTRLALSVVALKWESEEMDAIAGSDRDSRINSGSVSKVDLSRVLDEKAASCAFRRPFSTPRCIRSTKASRFTDRRL
jgi:hypothetical protein